MKAKTWATTTAASYGGRNATITDYNENYEAFERWQQGGENEE